MTRISVELVPRSVDSLQREASLLAEHAGWADTINVPDLTRFELRSWDACSHLVDTGRALIPHVRAVDCDPAAPLPFADALRTAEVREVVVITGDEAEWFRPAHPVDAVDVIRRVREELPGVTVWAGMDPYRQGIREELRYVKRKLAAGASGIFTQPFFDLDLARAWASMLPDDVPVWWGATTVTSPASMGYWQRNNGAVFPTDFDFSMERQRTIAQQVIDHASDLGHHVYLMPVRASVADYLSGLTAR